MSAPGTSDVTGGERYPARRDLSADEVHELASIWNEEFVEIGAKGLAERGIELTAGPWTAHLSWPAGPSHPGENILVTLAALDASWAPCPHLHPRAVTQLFAAAGDSFREIERMAQQPGAHIGAIELKAFQTWQRLNRAQITAEIAAEDLNPIPPDAQMAGVACLFTPDAEA